MSFTLDHSYKVLTSNGTFKGKVSALDSKFVTLEYWFERKSNFTMISLDSILSSESIPNESSNGFILSSNPDFIKAREDKAIYKRTEMALKLGKNVTPLAQAIFDALSIMPCRWEGDSIVIMDSVTVFC